jgi:antitoxin component HigA of HigAB toxin-antitoxin module
MSVAVKTPRIKQPKRANPHLLSFKRTTPKRVLCEARERYARYLTESADEEYLPIAETAWYRRMSKEMTPAKSLKTYREIAGFSQAHIGDLVGVPASRISDYETGQRSISKEMAKKLSQIFKTSAADFI